MTAKDNSVEQLFRLFNAALDWDYQQTSLL